MTQDLQELLEKIQRDGIDKAQGEADKLIAEAKAKAASIIKEAQAKAQATQAEAEQRSVEFQNRAEATIQQAARNTLLSVEQAVTKLLEQLLLHTIKTSFAENQQQIGALALEAARTYLQDADTLELASTEQLAELLRAQLAQKAQKGITVVTDPNADTGFSVRLADGRIEHAFTGAAITEVLARQLRPRLAALMSVE